MRKRETRILDRVELNGGANHKQRSFGFHKPQTDKPAKVPHPKP